VSGAPSALLLDDGELESVRLLLEDLGADFARVDPREAGSSRALAAPLLLTTARVAHALRLERTLSAGPNRPVWFAFVNGDSKTQRTALQKAGFDFLIREPVHPAALRVLLQRALFRGSDTRRAPRVACGHPVTYRTGFWPKKAMLVDLSPRGCRLLVTAPLREKTELGISFPTDFTRGKRLRLKGHVVRVTPADREGGVASELSVGVRFATLDSKKLSALKAVLADRVIGPASLGAAVPFQPSSPRPSPVAESAPAEAPAEAAPAPVRRRLKRLNRRARYDKQVTAVEGGAAYMILCRDLSVGGMRIEPVDGLAVGAKLSLAIQLSARDEPVMVVARVVRDDGEAGLALGFDWIAPESKRRIEKLLATLPSIEPLQEDMRRQGTILAQRVRESADKS
jgi:PilZ domain-containing protein